VVLVVVLVVLVLVARQLLVRETMVAQLWELTVPQEAVEKVRWVLTVQA
jgi:hypothetical protein